MEARGQGATEYLVLLAVVLIVALVSVALLGFFPGMASDAQITQSQAYWRGAQPIAITETGASVWKGSSTTYLYLRIRNNGAYPIRITGIVGADGAKATQFYGSGTCGVPAAYVNMQDYIYMAPGEEKYFIPGWAYGTTCDWEITGITTGSGGYGVGGAASVCQNSTSSPGTLLYSSFGFEYIEYVEGQQITKRQIGKQLAIKCREPFG